MGFDGQRFEISHTTPRKQTLSGIEKRIADLMGMISAARRRNPGWDTSRLEQELKELKGKQLN